MNWEEVSRLPREQLLDLFQDTLRNLVRMDGYWFLAVERIAGQEAAVDADEEVWRRFGRVEAFQTRKNFHIESDGIPALVEALRCSVYWPLWCDYEVDQTSPGEALFQVPRCGSQGERLKAGLGLFPCRRVNEAYLSAFAQTIDPRIKVTCLMSPPDNYREDMWCQWHFGLDGSC